jgi:DNA recombination protein RmuC
MTEILVSIVGLAVGACIILLILVLKKLRAEGPDESQALIDALDKNLERFDRLVKEESSRNRQESSNLSRNQREELTKTLRDVGGDLRKNLLDMSEFQRKQLGELRTTVDQKLTQLQQENAKKLDEMRKTVDEKLQGTLEKRLGESFKLVSERLEQVYRGLGEMRNLATGVGDLKKVLTNVKTRGTWGEIQLGNLLEQVLTPDQYDTNVATRTNSNERVEFAVKLPGRDHQDDKVVWLPIDAKFPVEDYHRLAEAAELGDAAAVETAGKQLEIRVKGCAKDIHDKYVNPPNTTDFAILFLPSESLYAEVLRRPGLVEMLQRDYRVNVAGPTTLAALLNSLQMGFRTLAIEKRSSEVWAILGAVKHEFGKFGGVIEKVQKKLQEASNTIDQAARRTRVMERQLRKVEELPQLDAQQLLGESPSPSSEDDGMEK